MCECIYVCMCLYIFFRYHSLVKLSEYKAVLEVLYLTRNCYRTYMESPCIFGSQSIKYTIHGGESYIKIY